MQIYTNEKFKEEYFATVRFGYYSKGEIFNNKLINVNYGILQLRNDINH